MLTHSTKQSCHLRTWVLIPHTSYSPKFLSIYSQSLLCSTSYVHTFCALQQYVLCTTGSCVRAHSLMCMFQLQMMTDGTTDRGKGPSFLYQWWHIQCRGSKCATKPLSPPPPPPQSSTFVTLRTCSVYAGNTVTMQNQAKVN